LKTEIVATIQKGLSPVQGRGRYTGYSESYKSQMGRGRYKTKRRRPVNLTLTGKMLRSIKSRQTNKGETIWFSDEKAAYHQLGTKYIPIRRLLPEANEELSRVIMVLLEKRLEKFVNDLFI
jgi:hypothetical protein